MADWPLYKIRKVFKTALMPKEIWEFLNSGGWVTVDGWHEYQIGWLVKECTENPEGYKPGFKEQAEKVDQWFVEHGAAAPGETGGSLGETILIEHG